MPIWIPDPPLDTILQGADNITVKHLWEVFISGVDPGEDLVIQDVQGKIIGTAKASSKGIAQLDAFVSPVENGKEVVIHGKNITPKTQVMNIQKSKPTSTSGQPNRRLMVKQTLLIQRAVIQLRNCCKHLSAGRLGGNTIIFCMFSNGVKIYDIENRDPILINEVIVSGLTGVVPIKVGLLELTHLIYNPPSYDICHLHPDYVFSAPILDRNYPSFHVLCLLLKTHIIHNRYSI